MPHKKVTLAKRMTPPESTRNLCEDSFEPTVEGLEMVRKLASAL